MQTYNNNSIKALTDREHVRLRPSMYIGNSNIQGLNQLIYEICDNSIDEYLEGYGNIINIYIYKDCSVRVQDFGRGVPVGMTKDANGHDINSLTLAFSKLMAGGKYNQKNYSVSSGTFGIGSSVVNFCSSFFNVVVKRDGRVFQQKFERGIPVTDVEIIGQTEYDENNNEITGTEIYYKPDPEIFQQTLQPSNEVRSRLIELAALNSGLTINYINDLTQSNETFYYENGITNYINEIVKDKKLLFDTPIYIKDIEKINDKSIQCEITFIIDDELESSSSIRSFVNNINTYMGGTHLNGLKNAIKNVCNDFGIKKKIIKESLEQKYYLDGFYAVISLKMQNPSFEGQTKIKLNNPEVEIAVENIIKRYFDTHTQKGIQDVLSTIVTHAVNIKAAELAAKKARAEKRSVNKITRQNLPVQLADCVNAGTAKYAEIFLCEGNSASGCHPGGTRIRLLDGRDVPIIELVKEYQEGKKNYVYCCDELGNIHVRPIINAFKTKHVNRLYRITFDNNQYVDFTPEHLIMMRDGTYKEVQYLQLNDSIMPLYMNIEERERPFYKDTYKMPLVMHNSSNKYYPVYQIVAQEYLGKRPKNYNTHHIDFNPQNNNPENLEYLTPKEHSTRHAIEQKYWDDSLIKQKISEKSKENWQRLEYREKMKFVYSADTNSLVKSHRERMQNDPEYKEEVITRFEKYRENNPNWQQDLSQQLNETYDINTERGQELRKKASEKSKEQWDNQDLRKWRAEETRKQLQKQKKDGTFKAIHNKAMQTRMENTKIQAVNVFRRLIEKNIPINVSSYTQERKQYMQETNMTGHNVSIWNKARLIVGFNARKDDVESIVRNFVNNFNHRVTKIEIIECDEDVYDITTPDYHNYALSAGVFAHNSIKAARDAKIMAILPLRGKVLNVEKASFEQFIKSPAIQRIIAAFGTGFGKSFNLENLRYDKVIMACFDGNTRVKLLNGTIKTFKELVELETQNPGQDYWVYSLDNNYHFVPGKMHHPRITQYVNDMVEITLDDNSIIKVTLDHKFMLRDGTYKRAQDLCINESLMPLYTKRNNKTSYNPDCELIYNNSKWEFTHHLVIKSFDISGLLTDKQVHHKDFNYLNNNPTNLEWLDKDQHTGLHLAEYNRSNKHKQRIKDLHAQGIYQHVYFHNSGYNQSEKNKETTRVLNKREDIKILQKQGRIIHSIACLIHMGYTQLTKEMFATKHFMRKQFKKILTFVPSIKFIDSVFDSFDNMIKLAIEYEQNKLTDSILKKFIKVQFSNEIVLFNIRYNNILKVCKYILDQKLEINRSTYERAINDLALDTPNWDDINQYFTSFDELKEASKYYNHKIINIKFVHYDKPIPVYCCTVDNYHNFAIVGDNDNSGIIVHNCDGMKS